MNAMTADNLRATDVMDEIVDGFAAYVSAAERHRQGARKYRGDLLWIHAIAGLLMAPAFAALNTGGGMSGTSWAFIRLFPGAPTSIAAILGTGGFVLGVGCILRSPRMEMIGLGLLCVFYMILGTGFTMANIAWYTGHLGFSRPATYTPILYLHLTVVMLVHVTTIIRRLRSGERE